MSLRIGMVTMIAMPCVVCVCVYIYTYQGSRLILGYRDTRDVISLYASGVHGLRCVLMAWSV